MISNYDDPIVLGEMLATGSHMLFGNTEFEKLYSCRGETFRWASTKNRVTVSAVNGDEDATVFAVENTGDGLTYLFDSQHNHTGAASIIKHAAKDYILKLARR